MTYNSSDIQHGICKKGSQYKYRSTGVALSIILLLLLTNSNSLLLAEDQSAPLPPSDSILVGVEYGYPPYSMVDSHGTARGFSVELIQASLEVMGKKAVFQVDSWEIVKQALEEKTIQALPLVGRTPERESIFDFTFPYLTRYGTIVVPEGRPIPENFEELAGLRVGVMEGDNAEEYVRRQTTPINLITTKTFQEALELLSAEKLDAVVMQRLLAIQLKTEMGLENLKIGNLILDDFKQSFCFAVAEGDDELLAILNEGLALSMANGTFDRLQEKWFTNIETSRVRDTHLIIGGDDSFPPYEFLDENGQPTGYNVDLTRAIAQEMGLDIEIRLGPWNQIYKELLRGEIDLVQGLYYSTGRDKTFSFSPPYTVMDHVLVRRRDSKPIIEFSELKTGTILVMKGNITHEYLTKQGYSDNLILTQNQEEALLRLSAGEADFALISRNSSLFWIEKLNLKNLVSDPESILSSEYNYGALDENYRLLLPFSQGLSLLKSNGIYHEITKKWLGIYEKGAAISTRTLIKLFLIVALPILLMGLAVAFWMKSLKTQVAKRTIELLEITEELGESEEKFRRLHENSGMGVGYYTVEGIVISYNHLAAQYMNGSPEEFVGKSLSDLFPPEEAAVYKERLALSALSEKPMVYEDKIIFSSETIWFLSTYSRIEGSNGSIIGIQILAQDITDRKLNENRIRESEAKYSSLFNTMIEGFALHEIILDDAGNPVDYRFLEINPAFERLTGLKKTEIIGKTVLSVLPETEPIWIENYGKVALTGEPMNFENYSAPLDRYYDIFAFSPAKNQFAVLFFDITKRKLAEARISEEREQLTVTLRSIGDGVITTDIQGNIVLVNRVAEELCGWSQKEAAGKPLSEVFNLINENTREPHENPVKKVLTTGEIIELSNHTLLIARDGTERIIADSGAPIKDKNSKTIGVVLVFRDMTEKSRLQEKLQRIDKLDSIGVLAGGIAHDFNNLLGGLFGYITMAQESNTEINDVTVNLEKAMTIYDRAKDLTRQILTFSKDGKPKRETGNLGKLIFKNSAFVLAGSNISCDYEIDEDLWLCDFDKNQIGQVIDNLLINAKQAMPSGGTISIKANNVFLDRGKEALLTIGKYVKIEIKDPGTGIPPELMSKIFDPFFTTKEKGNGLGLATCYSIIQKHEGHIDVESKPGKGTAFQIYLPAGQQKSENEEILKPALHNGSGSVLLMDDEDFIREVVGMRLKTMGYTIIEAQDGQEALARCKEKSEKGGSFSFALFDLTIPGAMGGKDAIMELRKIFPEIPVFASSGYSEDPIMANPRDFGFTDSIRKPFRATELSEMLNKYLGSNR
ncbi:MAG: transporter substrate-binding domain-containing protein [Spirochaetales bacterium]|nr:transporter substrate-binding domain-containing protein [Spirochaetales bacterium]